MHSIELQHPVSAICILDTYECHMPLYHVYSRPLRSFKCKLHQNKICTQALLIIEWFVLEHHTFI